LARRVEKIELDRRSRDISDDERRRHTELIRNLLVSINSDYKRRFGTPKVKEEEEDTSRNLILNESPRDIEMTA
jgi:hypothetical protein